MNYSQEHWVKIYTRDTASWLALSWQARGISLEIARKLPKATGELSLGRRGLEALGALLRAPWSEIEPFVIELLADCRLEYDPDRQVIRDPQHAARQAATTDNAEKQRRKRGTSGPTERHRATPADDAATPADTAATPRDTRATPAVRQEKRREEKEERESTRARTKATKAQVEGTPLPEDWTLSPALMAWAKGKGVTEHDTRLAAERFARHWHTSTKETAIKRSWDRAFQSWLDRDVTDGKVVAVLPRPVETVVVLTPEQIERRERQRALTAAAVAEMDANMAKAVGE